MLLIVDKNGNVLPAASLEFGGRIMHAGNNVWRVSQAGVPLTNEFVNTVTSPFTVSRWRSLTQEEATKVLTASKLRFATIWQATNEFTKNKFRELTKEVTEDANGTIEKTVTVGVTDFTVTNDFSASLMVTDYLSREITVTNQITGDRSKPGATVTAEITRAITVTHPADVTFAVQIYPYQIRGTNFTFFIQYFKITGDDFWDWEELDHTPGQALTISHIANPTGDTFLPTTISTTGWTNGGKEVTGCVFSGGTGSGTHTIRITDPELGNSIDIDISVDTAQTTLNPSDVYTYYAADAEYATNLGAPDYWEPDDWDAEATVRWGTMQNDLTTSFNADTTLAAAGGTATVGRHFMQDVYPYLYATCDMYGGYAHLTISSIDKQNLLATHLRIAPTVRVSYGNYIPIGTTIWSPYANYYTLKVKFTESSSSYVSGSAWRIPE